MKKKICVICSFDYANITSSIAYCINTFSSKYEFLIICQKKHPYDYQIKHMINYNLSEYNCNKIDTYILNNIIINFIKQSDLIILSDSLLYNETLLNPINPIILNDEYFPLSKLINIDMNIFTNKKIVYYYIVGVHTHNFYNIYNNIVNNSTGIIINNTYLNSLATHVNKYIVPYVHVYYHDRLSVIRQIIANKFKDNLINIGCFQTNRILKGFNYISQAIKLLQTKYNNVAFHDTNINNNAEIIKKRDEMTFIIDTYNTNNHGFGCTLYESLGSGCIVITSALGYQESYLSDNDIEPIPFISVPIDSNDHINNIYVAIESLLVKPQSVLYDMCLKSYMWYHKYMSPSYYSQVYEKFILDKIIN